MGRVAEGMGGVVEDILVGKFIVELWNYGIVELGYPPLNSLIPQFLNSSIPQFPLTISLILLMGILSCVMESL